MVLLDAYALIALVAGGPAQTPVRRLLREQECAVATLNLAEVFDVLERVGSVPPDRARAAIDPLLEGSIRTVPLTVELARRAAGLRIANYHRTRCPVSLGDCVLAASANPGDHVATADRHVLEIAERERLTPIELPAEDG